MICYGCKYEFPAGVKYCSECGAMLVYRFPDKRTALNCETDTSLVVLRRFNNSLDAELVRMTLTSAGIESLIRSEDSGGGMLPQLSFVRGIEILVWAEDLADAEAILSADASGTF